MDKKIRKDLPTGLFFTGIISFFTISFLFSRISGVIAISGILYIGITSLPLIYTLFKLTAIKEKNLISRLYYDKKTGLPNREKLRRDAIDGGDQILFLVNIDSFKEVNDFYGFNIGDFIIKELAVRLKDQLGKRNAILNGSVLYKLDADEYAILVKKGLGEKLLTQTAHVMSRNINEEVFRYKQYDIPVQVTIGIAIGHEYDSDMDDVHDIERTPEILARADMALKKAKSLNRAFLIYDTSMDIPKQYKENIRWTNTVKESIRNNRVIPYFQPIYNNNTGNIEKVECLIRLVDHEENIIYPSRFLKVSKKSRLYPDLTKIMIFKAIQEMDKTDFEYSVNLSFEDISNKQTAGYILNMLKMNPDKGPRLCFEILETENIEDFEMVNEFFDSARVFGCKVAIDDFGNGYSNFAYVTALQVDYLKMDASLIKNLDIDKSSHVITETIVDFCRKLGIKTIAEYVHSKEIYNIVRDLNIDYSQGYYLGEPVHDSGLLNLSGNSKLSESFS